jgi:hypothetical protein
MENGDISILSSIGGAMEETRPTVEYTLKCKVSRGMFSSERGIEIDLPDKHVIAFVDKRDVIVPREPHVEEKVEGRVKVAVLTIGEETALIDLPQPALTQGTRLRVPRAMVEHQGKAV